MLQRGGFSLLEVIVVVAIVGVVAAIAVPRVGSTADRGAWVAVRASAIQVQHAIEHYAAEHMERDPSMDGGGTVSVNGNAFIRRLTERTDDLGNLSPTGRLGPYLRSWPRNPVNGLSTVRIGGPTPGARTHGWRFNPATRVFAPDHVAHAAFTADPAEAEETVPAAPPIEGP